MIDASIIIIIESNNNLNEEASVFQKIIENVRK